MVPFLLDIAIAILLLVTIFFCWRLNRYIAMIKDSRSELSRVIQDFDQSTSRAQQSIEELRQMSEQIVDRLQVKVDKAEFMADDLSYILDKANKAADKLEKQVLQDAPAARKKAEPKGMISPKRARQSESKDDNAMRDASKQGIGAMLRKRPSASDDAVERNDEVSGADGKPLSKAERDLMEALKNIR